MPTPIDRTMVQRLISQGARLIEVLPPAEFDEEHLPGATSLPLRQLTAETTSTLSKSVPVITYCWDFT